MEATAVMIPGMLAQKDFFPVIKYSSPACPVYGLMVV
jgi:hypothetical protein